MAESFNLAAKLRVVADQGSARAAADQLKRILGNSAVTVGIKLDNKASAGIGQVAREMGTLKAQAAGATSASTAMAAAVDRAGAASARAAAQTSAASTSLAAQARAYRASAAAARDAAAAGEEFGRSVGRAFGRYAAFSAATAGVFALTAAFRKAVGEAAAFDLNLNKLRQVSDDSNRAVRETADGVLTLSRALGVSSKEMLGAAVTFKQAGFSLRQVREATEAVGLTQLAASFDGAAQSAEGAIAAFQQFGKGSSSFREQLGAMSAISNAFAAESRDLVVGVQKAGGAFAAAGSDLNEFLALLTSVRSTTRESAESIATGMRSLTSYFQRAGAGDALKGLGDSFRYTAQEAQALADPSLTGQFKGMYESVRVLNEALGKVRTTDPRYSAVVEELGGVRQLGRLIPLIQQYGEAKKAVAVARTGAAMLDVNREQAESRLLTRITRVQEAWQQTFNEVGQGRGFQKLVEQAEKLLTVSAQIADVLAPVLPVVAGGVLGQGLAMAGGFGRGVAGGLAGQGVTAARPPRRFAAGGWVVPGSGDGDTVPATLPAGSYVLRKAAVRGLRRAARVAPALGGLFGTPDADALAPRNQAAVAAYRGQMVQALLTPGEVVVGPDQARRIGVHNLDRMNRAGFSRGGVVRDKGWWSKVAWELIPSLMAVGHPDPDALNKYNHSLVADHRVRARLTTGWGPSRPGPRFPGGDPAGRLSRFAAGGEVRAGSAIDWRNPQVLAQAAALAAKGGSRDDVLQQAVLMGLEGASGSVADVVRMARNKVAGKAGERPLVQSRDPYTGEMVTKRGRKTVGSFQDYGDGTLTREFTKTTEYDLSPEARAVAEAMAAEGGRGRPSALTLARRQFLLDDQVPSDRQDADPARRRAYLAAVRGAAANGLPLYEYLSGRGHGAAIPSDVAKLTKSAAVRHAAGLPDAEALAFLSDPNSKVPRAAKAAKPVRTAADPLAPFGISVAAGATLDPKAATGLAKLVAKMPAGAMKYLLDRGLTTNVVGEVPGHPGSLGGFGVDKGGVPRTFVTAAQAATEGLQATGAGGAKARRSTLLHEMVHGLDHYAGNFSRSDAWKTLAPAAAARVHADSSYAKRYGSREEFLKKFDPNTPEGRKELFAESANRYLVHGAKTPPELKAAFDKFFAQFRGDTFEAAEFEAKRQLTKPIPLDVLSPSVALPLVAGVRGPGYVGPTAFVPHPANAATASGPFGATVYGPGTRLPAGAGPGRSDPFVPASGGGGGRPPVPPSAGGSAPPPPPPGDPNFAAWAAMMSMGHPGDPWDATGLLLSKQMNAGWASWLKTHPDRTHNTPLMAGNWGFPDPSSWLGRAYAARANEASEGATLMAGRWADWEANNKKGVSRTHNTPLMAGNWAHLQAPPSGLNTLVTEDVGTRHGRKTRSVIRGFAAPPDTWDMKYHDLVRADVAAGRRGLGDHVSDATWAPLALTADGQVADTSGRLARESQAKRHRELEYAIERQLHTKGADRAEARLMAQELAQKALANDEAVISNKKQQVLGLASLGPGVAPRTSWRGVGHRAASWVGDRFRPDGGVMGYMALSSVGAIAGDQLSPSAQSYAALAAGGGGRSAGGLKAQAAAGGALQGAATGAAVGMAFGPHGAAVGAAVGGLFGFAHALSDASDRIREAKLDKAVEDLAVSLDKVRSGRLTMAEGGGRLASDLAAARGVAGEKAYAAADGYFRGPNAQELSAARLRESRLALGPQLAGLFMTAQKEAETLGRKNLGVDVGGAEKLLAGSAAFRELVGAMTDVGQFETAAEGFREFAQEMVKSAQAAKRQADVERDRGRAAGFTLVAGRLAEGVENARLGAAASGGRAAALEALLGGGEAPLRDVSSHFKPGLPGSGFDLLRSAGGEAGGRLAAELAAGSRVRDALPEVLAKLADNLDEDNVPVEAERLLRGRLGGGAGDPVLGRYIQSAVNEIGAYHAANKDKGGLAALRGGAGTEAAADDITRATLEPKEKAAAEFASRLRAGRLDFTGGLARGRGFGRAALEGYGRGDALGLDAARMRAELADPFRNAADVLGVGALSRPFAAGQARLGAGGLGAEGAAAALAEAMKGLEGARLARDAAQTGGPGAFEGAAEAYSAAEDKVKRLQTALEKLGDAAGRTAGLQEKLGAVQSSLAGRRGWAERMIFADGNERARMNLGKSQAEALIGREGDFAGLGRVSQRRILESLGAMGDMRLAGGVVASKLRERLVDAAGGGGLAAERGEADGLKAQIAAAFEDAAKANEAAGKFTETAGDAFLAAMRKEHETFLKLLDDQQKQAADKVKGVDKDHAAADARKGREDAEAAKLLGQFGLGTKDRLEAFRGKGGPQMLRNAMEAARKRGGLLTTEDVDSRTGSLGADQLKTLVGAVNKTNQWQSLGPIGKVIAKHYDGLDPVEAKQQAVRSVLDQRGLLDGLDDDQKIDATKQIADRLYLTSGYLAAGGDIGKVKRWQADRGTVPTTHVGEAFNLLAREIVPNVTKNRHRRLGADIVAAQGSLRNDAGFNPDPLPWNDPKALAVAGDKFLKATERFQAATEKPEDVVHRAAGGWVPDLGNAGSLAKGRDTALLAAEPGEFVVRRSVAQKHKNLLERINYRSGGGFVSGPEDGGALWDQLAQESFRQDEPARAAQEAQKSAMVAAAQAAAPPAARTRPDRLLRRLTRMDATGLAAMTAAKSWQGRFAINSEAHANVGRVSRAWADDPVLSRIYGGVAAQRASDSDFALSAFDEEARAGVAGLHARAAGSRTKRLAIAAARKDRFAAISAASRRQTNQLVMGTPAPLGGAANLAMALRPFSFGGVVPGASVADNIPALLKGGEGVLTPNGVRAIGGAAGLAAVNNNAGGGSGGGGGGDALAKALAAFVGPADKLTGAFGRFVTAADRLSDSINKMPREMTAKAEFTHHHYHHGEDAERIVDRKLADFEAKSEDRFNAVIDRRVPNAEARGPS